MSVPYTIRIINNYYYVCSSNSPKLVVIQFTKKKKKRISTKNSLVHHILNILNSKEVITVLYYDQNYEFTKTTHQKNKTNMRKYDK